MENLRVNVMQLLRENLPLIKLGWDKRGWDYDIVVLLHACEGGVTKSSTAVATVSVGVSEMS
jgi:hypothetical protein